MGGQAVFIDTGAFYALIDRDDPHHVIACKEWAEILRQKCLLIITCYIVSETYTLLRYRLGWAIACKFLQVMEESRAQGRIRIIAVPERTEGVARHLLLQFGEEDLSYIDAVSLAAIKTERIPLAFSFDEHFQLAEAKVIP